MRRLLVAAVLLLAACGQAGRGELPTDLAGRWEVQQIAGASLGEGVDIWMEIDAASGEVRGFTGCNNFSTTMSAFGTMLAVAVATEEPGECPSEAASTDEQRFLMVLPLVQRHIRRGRSLELLQAASGTETLIRLRESGPSN
jgi:hypothetical protein